MKSLAKILLCATVDHLRRHPHHHWIFFSLNYRLVVSFRSFWNVLSSSCPILPRLSLRNELLDAGKWEKKGAKFQNLDKLRRNSGVSFVKLAT
jgi:hypothetical protein